MFPPPGPARTQQIKAAKLSAQQACARHHAELLARLAGMGIDERRICYGLPPAPVRRLKLLALAPAPARVEVPQVPAFVNAAWRALWLAGHSLSCTFNGRAAL
jgi:hypothetical protein